jgi:protein-S-isoprenylcysteine O-methyltransferase Ste14
MNKLMDFFLGFTQKSYSTSYKILSLIPGTIVFLLVSPLFLFYFSRSLSSFIPISWPRTFEITITAIALFLAITLMSWGMLSLWIHGKGTPAPIAPTKDIVTTGAYKYCRNPIELGTGLYFLALGTFLDTLTTGIFCMILGMMLGYGYIKIIEERELKLRFGKKYEEYLASSPLFLPNFFSQKENRHD